MATRSLYGTARWRRLSARARKRDGDRCTVARLLGGDCSGRLHAHHLRPVSEGGAPFDLDNVVTACSSHHPVLEAFRRRLLGHIDGPAAAPPRPHCRHFHRTIAARQECEARLARSIPARQHVA